MLPMEDSQDNSAIVNALQRAAYGAAVTALLRGRKRAGHMGGGRGAGACSLPRHPPLLDYLELVRPLLTR